MADGGTAGGPGRRRPSSPPLVTIVSIALILIAMWLLRFRSSDGSHVSDRFVAGVPWFAWTAVAGLSLAVFAVSFAIGLRAILWPPEALGLDSMPVARRYRYLAVAFLLVAAIAVAMFAGTGAPPAVASMPVSHILLRTRGVVLVGFAATIPWLALVWLAHAICSELPVRAATGTVVSDETGTVVAEDDTGAVISRLQRLWRLMTQCITAAAISVVVAIVTAGALRAAFLAYAPSRGDDFPASNVLLYGAFFAVLQAAIGLPLVISWRGRARELVERTYPLPAGGRPTETWWDDRRRLETLLHLNIPLLRNPLAALSIFAPLVTSALAVFIPQLATG
jgi:hypothetical protein